MLWTGAPPAAAQSPADPPYSVDVATLDAALDCDPLADDANAGAEPVLLVHGTGTRGHEQYDWNYGILLRETGHDVCILTYPNRGFDDMQVSAEYVARAVQRMHAESGRAVDMVGHSQGALMPRWAVKWWPSVQAAVDDFVLLAGPNHGTTVVDSPLFLQRSGAVHQMRPSSAFVAALNAGDETPGTVDHTSIYTRFDELVQPTETAALDPAGGGGHLVNILLQDLCPGRLVDHLSIGTTDVLTQRLVLDALDGDGPADPERAGIDPVLCNLPDQYVVPETFPNIVALFEPGGLETFPEYHPVAEEPPLKPYAAGDSGTAEPQPAAPGGSTGAPVAEPRVGAAPTLPATGRAIPILAAGIAIGVALLLRAGASRLSDGDAEPEPDRDADHLP